MESYIHLYETNKEFTAAYNGSDYKEPWLSLTEEGMKVNYNKPKLTAITFGTITWVKDVPATGGTATKDNCEFKVYGNYDNGISVDISSDATVTGELAVEPSTEGQRHEAGQLTLTASYSGFTATGNVTVYQAAVDFSTKPLTFNILSDGTINWTASNTAITKTIDYKKNNGEWVSITSNTDSSAPSIDVNPGDKIQFRGDNTAYCGDNPESHSTFGGSTAGFEIEGNIMSLINSTDFSTLTTLESGFTFAGLFSNCTGLTSAENLILPATPLAMGCYFQMFYGCTSLTTAPELPAIDLEMGCYAGMFIGCTSLTTAPELTATTLAVACYDSMFGGCTSLKTAPELPATTLAMGCYNMMFQGCTSLNYIKCLATDISETQCTSDWVDGVAATGTFVKAADMSRWTTGNSGIPSGWAVEDNQEPLTFNILSAGTINWAASSTDATKTIDYKVNDGAWVSITSNTGSSAPTITVNSGDKVQFRGNNTQYATSESNYNSFNGSTALFKAKGNIMSLIYGDDFKNKLTISSTYAFASLFRNCTNLVSAENLILPSTTLAQYCYEFMFSGCTSLTTAPELPARTLASHCYYNMFMGCTSLTTAPELPARTLASHCYYNMFMGCTSLTTAPELPARTLASHCYYNMFMGCTSLNYIKCLAENISADSCTSNWVDGVAATGTFIKSPDMSRWIESSDGIPTGWIVADNKEPLTFKISSPGTVNWTASDSSVSKTIEYKLNDKGWVSITSNTGESAPSITVTKGDKLQFRGNNTAYCGDNPESHSTFGGSTAGFEIEGSIMSLINSTRFVTAITLDSAYTFSYLFNGCTGLTSAENLILPATTLAERCYYEMFQGCTSLTTAPELPATTLADSCYYYMFNGCSSLKTAPELPATKLADYCYYQMFQGCSSLTTAPELPAATLVKWCYNRMFEGCSSLTTAPELPATTLATYCYGSMFEGCSSLKTAPKLPATTLADSCYSGMFIGCTSLTTAPALPATTLIYSCYSNMFSDCTSLTTAPALPAIDLANNCYSAMFKGCSSLTTAPVLPATTLAQNCYRNMFQNCTSLTAAPALPATTLADSCYSYMFYGCTSLTTAPALPATTLIYSCYSNMFSDCTSLTTAPALPATTLANYCYRSMFAGCTSLTTAPSILPADTLARACYDSMFSNCTSLTTAPALPVMTLVEECYSGMFYGCTKLTYIKCLATNISAFNCTYNWVNGVAATGTFVKAADMSRWTTGTKGIPEGWTVQNA